VSFLKSSKSELIISYTNSSRVILGSQPSFFFAFDGSPTRRSTSEGLKYFSSIDKTSFPISSLYLGLEHDFILAISSIPSPVNSSSTPI